MAEEGFRIARAFVEVDPDTEGFSEKLKAALEEATADAKATVPVDADTEPAKASIDELKGDLDDLTAEEHSVKVGLDKGEFDAGRDELKGDLDEIAGREVSPKAGLDKAGFDAGRDEVLNKLDDLDMERADPKAGLNADEFFATAELVSARMDELKAKSETLNLGGAGGGASAGGAASAGGGEGGGMLGGIVGGLAALSPGIGGAATGLGFLAGTGALAMGGIFKAVSAAHQATLQQQQYSQQLAATEFQDSVQIQQAQLAIGSAHMQAAQDAANSANQIIMAEQQVGQAEHNLADAQYAETQAQVALTEARIQARLQAEQLANAVKDAALAEQGASLSVQQAKYQQLLTDQNAYSTSLDRQQAALAVAQAEQQLTEATQNSKNATMENSAQNRQYFDGQQQIIQAEHALSDAQYGVKQALLQVTDAVRNLALARSNAAYTSQRDALAVQAAERNLTNTYKQQAFAMEQLKASSPWGQYRLDMERLSPAGRHITRMIDSMGGGLRRLEHIAQTAIAPGILVFLRGMRSLWPEVKTGVKEMGGAISQAFTQFGNQMKTPAFAHVFDGLIRNGLQFVNTVLPAFASFIQELAKIGSAQGAVSGLANLLAGLGNGLTGLVATLGHYTPLINQFLTVIGKVLTAAGPALANLLGTTLQVLSPILRFLNSPGGKPFITILGDLVAGFIAWKVASKLVIGPVKSAIEGAGKFIGMFREDGAIAKFGSKVAGVFKGIGSVASNVWEGISGAASQAWIGIKLAAESAASKLSAVWGGITSAASSTWGAISSFGTKFGSMMSSAAGSVVSFVATLGSRLAAAATATGAWVAEHAIATASFIAENVAMAASATVAFIAENAATLGLVAGITALVGAIVYLATHWQQVWGDIKKWAEDAWHFIYDGFGKYLLPLLGPVGLIALGAIEVAQHWSTIWNGIKSVTESVFGGIMTGVHSFTGSFASAWNTLENIFKVPVNFLITTVYDNGIRKLWDDVVGAVGMKSLDLPVVSPLAHGGVIPGYSPGHDSVPALLSPGEGVLTPQAVQAIGPGTVHALNQQYGGGGHSPAAKMAAKLPLKELARHATERPAEHAATFGKFSGGGIVGDVGGFFSGAAHAVAGGLGDVLGIGKLALAVMSGNTTAFANAMDAMIKAPDASGNLAKLMIALPKALITKAISQLSASMFSAGGGVTGASSGAIGELPANWKEITSFLAAHGFTKYAAAGVAGNIFAECVPADYQILTRRGWLKYSQVKPGDETIGYNPETGKSEWTRIIKVNHYDVAPTVRYGNAYWSAECTPGHKWLMERVTRVPDREVPAACPDCGVTGTPRGGTFRTWQQFQIHRARAHKAYGPANGGQGERGGWVPERVTSTGLVRLEDMRRDHRIVLARKAETTGTLDITTQEAALLGWVAGDGNVPGKPGFGWYVYQSKPHNFAAIDAACAADPRCTKYHRQARHAHWKPCVEWHLSAAYCRDLETRAGHPKRDTVRQVLSMSTEQRAAWLEAMLLAEGCSSGGKTSYYQNAGEIADAIEIAVYLAGHRPGRRERVRPEWSDAIAVTITQAAPHVGGPNRRSFTEDAGTQPVWCPATELGTWTARGPETAAFLTGNSGGNPEILEIGGGGGGGLIQWTPYPAGYITGNYQQDLMTQLYAILRWGGGPGMVNRATSPSNAAAIYQDYYERPASLTASIAARMASANAVFQAMGWGTASGGRGSVGSRFDSGGWLMPAGMPGSAPVNTTGQPEAVLTPQQSQALIAVASKLTPGSDGASALGATVNFNYFGPQQPTPEMQAIMKRDLAMTLGG